MFNLNLIWIFFFLSLLREPNKKFSSHFLPDSDLILALLFEFIKQKKYSKYLQYL